MLDNMIGHLGMVSMMILYILCIVYILAALWKVKIPKIHMCWLIIISTAILIATVQYQIRSAGMVSPKLVEKLSGLMALVYLIPWMFISKFRNKKEQ